MAGACDIAVWSSAANPNLVRDIRQSQVKGTLQSDATFGPIACNMKYYHNHLIQNEAVRHCSFILSQ